MKALALLLVTLVVGSIYAAECFCEVPFADERLIARFRKLHAMLTEKALPAVDQEHRPMETEAVG
jgi:hypothetical protein